MLVEAGICEYCSTVYYRQQNYLGVTLNSKIYLCDCRLARYIFELPKSWTEQGLENV